MKKIFLFFLTALFSVAFADAQTISATALKNAAVGAFGKYQPTGANTATPGYGVPLKVGSDGGVLPSSDPLPPAAPTLTPTPTFTWNATTTRTQPPTSTPTATNTPYYESITRIITVTDNTFTSGVTFSYPYDMVYCVANYSSSPTSIIFAAIPYGTANVIEWLTSTTSGNGKTKADIPISRVGFSLLGTVTPGPVTIYATGYSRAVAH